MKEKRDWNQVVKDYEASGMSVKEFCKENHISMVAFYKNKKILKNDESTENIEETFTQINIQDPDLITFTINGIDITCDRSDVRVFLEAVK